MFMNGCWGCLCEAKTKKTKSPVWMSYRIRYTFMKMSRKIKCWKMEAYYACEESCIFSLAAWLHKAFMKCYSLCTLLINIYMLWNHPQSHPHPAPSLRLLSSPSVLQWNWWNCLASIPPFMYISPSARETDVLVFHSSMPSFGGYSSPLVR